MNPWSFRKSNEPEALWEIKWIVELTRVYTVTMISWWQNTHDFTLRSTWFPKVPHASDILIYLNGWVWKYTNCPILYYQVYAIIQYMQLSYAIIQSHKHYAISIKPILTHQVHISKEFFLLLLSTESCRWIHCSILQWLFSSAARYEFWLQGHPFSCNHFTISNSPSWLA